MHRPPLLPLLAVAVLASCEDPPALAPETRVRTFRALTGISMGAMGTGSLGPSHADRFDGAAMLGGPLDAALLLRMVDRFHLGGTCPREALEALNARDPRALNDPRAVADCEVHAEPIRYEHSQGLNHWVYSFSGGFNRNDYADLFSDLSLAYGNFLYENPVSPYAPPGVPVEQVRRPPPDFCQKPVRVRGFRNRELNPDGRYDAITFCDGESPVWFCSGTMERVDFCADPANVATPLPRAREQEYAAQYCDGKGGAQKATEESSPLTALEGGGRFDGCREALRPVRVALALDVNGNGRRDYGEPVLNNGQERFDDVGGDGCADRFEDGRGGCGPEVSLSVDPDPNRDNYRAAEEGALLANPLGTERSWLWDPGEPFRDDGLDGVPGTGDVGEGNGQFDLSSGRRRLLASDSRAAIRGMSARTRNRLAILLDGGVRDLFNFGLMSQQLFGLIRHYRPEDSLQVRAFADIPGMRDERSGAYKPWGKRWDTVPKNLFVFYGKERESLTNQDRIDGEGDHVGTTGQAVDRFFTLFNWTGALWADLPRPFTPYVGAGYDERELHTWYDSKLLGGKRSYSVFLPPGYEAEENSGARYPVAYVLHGYGQAPEDLVSTSFIADAYMKDEDIRLQPMILVFANGSCCFVCDDETGSACISGARDCREEDDAGSRFDRTPGWTRECKGGTFYVNRTGYGSADAYRYGDSLFELMTHVDATYRTLPATTEVAP